MIIIQHAQSLRVKMNKKAIMWKYIVGIIIGLVILIILILIATKTGSQIKELVTKLGEWL